MTGACAPTALLFTQQLVGFGGRKTGMVYWAEALARMGWRTHAVTTQLSWLSRLAGSPRLAATPRDALNRWCSRGENLSSYVWEAPIHPARLGRLDALVGDALVAAYAAALPQDVIDIARRADLIVVESCAAVALIERLRAIAPSAKLVYCASDRLDQVGMSSALSRTLERTLGAFDLIRVSARAMLTDFGPEARVALIPQGVDKKLIDAAPAGPPNERRTAVVAGDMAFDSSALAVALRSFPDLEIHAFGRMDLHPLRDCQNLIVHGETPFPDLARYMRAADIGFAPYVERARLDYLAESSLKLLQYTHCRLPIVAPHFATGGRPHIIGYKPGDARSIRNAFQTALDFDRTTIAAGAILEWEDVMRRLLSLLDWPVNSAVRRSPGCILERST
jgi:2-beta-glucuronyltransferase